MAQASTTKTSLVIIAAKMPDTALQHGSGAKCIRRPLSKFALSVIFISWLEYFNTLERNLTVEWKKNRFNLLSIPLLYFDLLNLFRGNKTQQSRNTKIIYYLHLRCTSVKCDRILHKNLPNSSISQYRDPVS